MNSDNSYDLPDSWSKWFLKRESTPIIDKSFKAKLFESFDETITEDKCKDMMLKQDEIAFLF